MQHPSVLLLFMVLMALNCFSQTSKNIKPPSPVSLGSDGRMVYAPDAKGNRVPDFSYAGYQGGDQAIPDAPTVVYLPSIKGDATERIQFALDKVAAMPADSRGIRGAVLLGKGKFEIRGSLHINAPGVVLRGSGSGPGGTELIASRTDRETLIKVEGKMDRQLETPVAVSEAYVPVNAKTVAVSVGSSFKPGDKVIIHRPSTKKWIEDLGTEDFGGGISYLGWKPGQRDLFFDRTVIAVNGQTLTLDAPLTTALDTTYGQSTVARYNWPGRITEVGIENMKLSSTYDPSNPKDEEHAWMAITMENISNAWVRQLKFEHFAGSAVALLETASRITVEDCISQAPISEIAAQRRNTFLTLGQQTLFQRCYAENGYHDFSVGFCAPGPNAFVQCDSHLPHSFSGTTDSWASGVLFDIVNIDGQALCFMNRGMDGQGAGWSAANSLFWQSTAARIDCYAPPTAMNWAFGSWAQFSGNGYWENSNEQIKPRSLYYAQLQDRLGQSVAKRIQLLKVESEASSSPSIEVANALTLQAKQPPLRLVDFIANASARQPIPTSSAGIKTVDQLGFREKTKTVVEQKPMAINNGWLVRDHKILTGSRQDVPWWSGSSRPYALDNSKPHLTRFVPGKTGRGLTDDLEKLSDEMVQKHQLVMEHNYALWYDRRRDDHERIRRMNGEVWTPFYEVPFARSGRDTAWDGLSKYDLTRYNKWYWNRLKKFADLADSKGLVLFHQNYFQHNIIEAGAHYTDFTWRPANNINHTGFPEPVPYAGDKRIFMAEQFYDVNHPIRRKLHRAYIRQCLDNFKDNGSVIQSTSAEFTGPTKFVRFWLEVIREWEKENGNRSMIALSATKDVQDSILADPTLAAVVDLIDIRYWHYRDDGTVYAPPGGQNLAPRQHARLVKPGRSSFEQVYRAVREYRQKFPSKAVVYSGEGYDQLGWASFMAGGSMANLPGALPEKLLEDATHMKPERTGKNNWHLAGANSHIFYVEGNGSVIIDLAGSKGQFQAIWINPRSGDEIKKETITGGKNLELSPGKDGPSVLWIYKLKP